MHALETEVRGSRAALGSLLVLFLCLATRSAGAQEWQVDLANAAVVARSNAFADMACNDIFGVGYTGPCPWRPGPPWDVPLCPPGPIPNPGTVHEREYKTYPADLATNPTGPLLAPFWPYDFGAGIDASAVDDDGVLGSHCPPTSLVDAQCFSVGQVVGDGLGTHKLELVWQARVGNSGSGEGQDLVTNGCADLDATFQVGIQNVPNSSYIVRYDWFAFGDANNGQECPLGPFPPCAVFGIPPWEDVALANLDLNVSFNSTGLPGSLFPQLSVDNDSPLPTPGVSPNFLPPVQSNAVFMSAGSPFSASFHVFAGAGDLEQYGLGVHQTIFQGEFTFWLVVHEFVTDEPFETYMRPVSGGYPLLVGRYEITNQQYASFLNSAEYDLGQTELSSFMVFQADGCVTLSDGTPLFEPQGVAPDSRIEFSSGAPIGTRYTVEVALGSDPRTYERHPVTNVTWFGAAKFCNWLTMKRGLGPGERCYTEGPSAADWHPATITSAAWGARDLTDAERGLLVTRYRGFRLPMDDLGTATGWIGDQDGTFNEWYRAAAFDPAAPQVARIGPGGENVPAYHWVYGFGRDSIGGSDANFLSSTDPFDDDDAFVGMYSGAVYNGPGAQLVGSGSLFASSADDNPWDIYDLSGNIVELTQDRPSALSRAVRGGSWLAPAIESAASHRQTVAAAAGASNLGFRIVQAGSGRLGRARDPESVTRVTFP